MSKKNRRGKWIMEWVVYVPGKGHGVTRIVDGKVVMVAGERVAR